jgi:hypothetical protein
MTVTAKMKIMRSGTVVTVMRGTRIELLRSERRSETSAQLAHTGFKLTVGDYGYRQVKAGSL